MQDSVCELRRIPILRRWVNKDHQARLRLLVNDEHALAKLVRCSPYAAFGVHILRSKLCELLVGGGKLAGRECFTSAGCHDDAHSASSVSRALGVTTTLIALPRLRRTNVGSTVVDGLWGP